MSICFRFITASFCFLSLLGLSSCEPRADIERANEERIFIFGNAGEPQGIDPHLVSGVTESKIITALFEGLCADHPSSDTTILPGVAERWESNEDATEWTFHLRKDAVWSDGEPLTSSDFIFAYRRMLTPAMGAKYAEMLYFIDGAEEFNKSSLGKILCGNDPGFPVAWDKLKAVNFSGDKSVKVDDLSELTPSEMDDDQLRQWFAHEGLDQLDRKLLERIRGNQDLFGFPESLTQSVVDQVLDRLIAHHKAGSPDLWDKAKVGVAAPDAHTLVVRCKESVPYLPSVVRHYTWFPVPEHAIMAIGEGETMLDKMTDRGSRWTTVEHFVGNGPFNLAEWKFNSYILTEKNPRYWDAGNVWLEGVKFIPTVNPYTEYRAYLNGQLHTTATLPNELVDHAREHRPDALRLEPYVGSMFLRINTRRKPLDEVKLREALNLAVDRQAITDNLLLGYSVATSYTPLLGDFEPNEILRYDPGAARQALAEAGFESGSELGPISLLTTSRETSRTLAEALQAMWKRELGIEVQVSNQEWTTYLTSVHQGDFDIVLGGWIGDYLDPTTFLKMWIKGGGNNNTGWSSQEFENLLEKAGHEANATKRLEILRQADACFMRGYAVVPIAYYGRKYLLHPSVQGWHPLALDNHPYKSIRLKPIKN